MQGTDREPGSLNILDRHSCEVGDGNVFIALTSARGIVRDFAELDQIAGPNQPFLKGKR